MAWALEQPLAVVPVMRGRYEENARARTEREPAARLFRLAGAGTVARETARVVPEHRTGARGHPPAGETTEVGRSCRRRTCEPRGFYPHRWVTARRGLKNRDRGATCRGGPNGAARLEKGPECAERAWAPSPSLTRRKEASI